MPRPTNAQPSTAVNASLHQTDRVVRRNIRRRLRRRTQPARWATKPPCRGSLAGLGRTHPRATLPLSPRTACGPGGTPAARRRRPGRRRECRRPVGSARWRSRSRCGGYHRKVTGLPGRCAVIPRRSPARRSPATVFHLDSAPGRSVLAGPQRGLSALPVAQTWNRLLTR